MDILFASGAPYLPQVFGGVNTNTHELATELVRHGHRPAVLARLAYGHPAGLRMSLGMALQRRSVSHDTKCGYSVFRAREPWVLAADIPRPDIVVIQDGYMLQTAAAFAGIGVPVIAYFHGLEFEEWMADGQPAQAADLPPIAGFFANSEFTARRFLARYGRRPLVIPPVFCAERYRTARNPSSVIFVNPVAEKGVEIALGVAERCPEIPFSFVKGWPIPAREWLRLNARLKHLPNVRLIERTWDMRSIYRNARILLAPSQWEAETWGRVVSEAHISGIPVVASDRGGLPEAVGPGGTVMGANQPLDEWVRAVRLYFEDEAFYAEKSAAALTYSMRGKLDMDSQVNLFLHGLLASLDASNSPGKSLLRA